MRKQDEGKCKVGGCQGRPIPPEKFCPRCIEKMRLTSLGG
jgi:hypothetical protein